MVFVKEQSTENAISQVVSIFDQASCICKGKSPGRLPVNEAKMDGVWTILICIPHKSMRHATHSITQYSMEMSEI